MNLSLQEQDAEVSKRKAEKDRIPGDLEDYLDSALEEVDGFWLSTVYEASASPGRYKAAVQASQTGRKAQVYMDETGDGYQTTYVNVDDPEVGQEERWERNILEQLDG